MDFPPHPWLMKKGQFFGHHVYGIDGTSFEKIPENNNEEKHVPIIKKYKENDEEYIFWRYDDKNRKKDIAWFLDIINSGFNNEFITDIISIIDDKEQRKPK